jgi:FkbM family methyltransferase
MQDVELIISANGCVDNTNQYLNDLIAKFNEIGFSNNIKVVWSDNALGYAKATNEGIKVSTGQKIILLNNDTVLLEQEKNKWIDLLVNPFKNDPNCGITGPVKQWSSEANHQFIIFFCTMIDRRVFNAVGLLSEDYGVGGGEDIEFCIEAERRGFKVAECAEKQILSPTSYTGIYPIYHEGEATMNDKTLVQEWKSTYYYNGLRLARKYNLPYFKKELMNNFERYLSVKGEPVDGRESARYLWAASNVIGNKVLEVGCSNGYGSQFLSQDIDYTGVDYDSKIIKFAKMEQWGNTRQFVHADINTFDLDFYDTIIAFEVIEHLDNGLEIVEKLKKHCRRLLISVPYKETPGFWGEHHRLHMLDESHLPGFEYKYIDRDGNVNDTPADPLMNLMLCKHDSVPVINHDFLKYQEPHTYNEIFEINCYSLKLDDVRGKTVVDIGANLGMFSLRCVEWAAERILAVEAQPVIYREGLLPNTQHIKQIEPLFYAVYDKDGLSVEVENLHLGSNVSKVSDTGTPTITLKTLLEKYNVEGDNLVLKLDCEGSEFNILLTSDEDTLNRFSVIFIEMHGSGRGSDFEKYDNNAIRELLTNNGFTRVHSVGNYQYIDDVPTIGDVVVVEKWIK